MLLLLIAVSGCHQRESPSTVARLSAVKPVVATTSYALFEITALLLSDDGTVQFPNSNKGDPRSWKPTAVEISNLQAADLILLNGANYEPWALSVSLPMSRTIDTSLSYDDRLLRVKDAVTHQHGPQGETESSESICSTWLSSELLQLQAECVAVTLRQRFPDLSDQISARQKTLAANLRALHDAVQALRHTTPVPSVTSDVPELGYLLRDVGWEVCFEKSDQSATSEMAGARIQLVTGKGVAAEDTGANRQQMAGGIAVDIDLCESQRAGENMFDRLSANLRRLTDALNTQRNE